MAPRPRRGIVPSHRGQSAARRPRDPREGRASHPARIRRSARCGVARFSLTGGIAHHGGAVPFMQITSTVTGDGWRAASDRASESYRPEVLAAGWNEHQRRANRPAQQASAPREGCKALLRGRSRSTGDPCRSTRNTAKQLLELLYFPDDPFTSKLRRILRSSVQVASASPRGFGEVQTKR